MSLSPFALFTLAFKAVRPHPLTSKRGTGGYSALKAPKFHTRMTGRMKEFGKEELKKLQRKVER